MKRFLSIILLVAVLLSCFLTGCYQQQLSTHPTPGTQPSVTHPDPSVLPQRPEDPIDNPTVKRLWMGDSGKMRVRYVFNQSSVRYIISADQLPDYEQLNGFDEAFFAEKALVLVTETVASGSVDVSIESIKPDGKQAVVTLRHEMPDGIGTEDMTTWLIWVVVDRGLDYNWVVSNPAIGNDTSNILIQ